MTKIAIILDIHNSKYKKTTQLAMSCAVSLSYNPYDYNYLTNTSKVTVTVSLPIFKGCLMC